MRFSETVDDRRYHRVGEVFGHSSEGRILLGEELLDVGVDLILLAKNEAVLAKEYPPGPPVLQRDVGPYSNQESGAERGVSPSPSRAAGRT